MAILFDWYELPEPKDKQREEKMYQFPAFVLLVPTYGYIRAERPLAM